MKSRRISMPLIEAAPSSLGSTMPIKAHLGVPKVSVKSLIAAVGIASAGMASGQVTMTWLTISPPNFGFVGGDPRCVLVRDSYGTLYGTTYSGGTGSKGTVFKVNTDGSGYTVLHNFPATASDGLNPIAGLAFGTDGTLYGATSLGGTSTNGTVFKLKPDGSGYAVLYSFVAGGAAGRNPRAKLLWGSDGTLYGTTPTQWGSGNQGTIFKVNPNSGAYTLLYNAFPVSFSDDGGPSALIEGSDAALYGATADGGTNGGGTVFKINKNGSGYRVLHHFGDTGGDGTQPLSALLKGNDGALYGTTFRGGGSGGVGAGTVFRINEDGSGYTILHVFSVATADSTPNSPLIQDPLDGALYGSTQGFFGGGEIFRIKKDGTGYTPIFTFGPIWHFSSGLLLGSDHAFYGTTPAIGNSGSIFRLSFIPPAIGGIWPGSQSVLAGNPAVFSAYDVSGTPPLAYQWQLHGTNLPGATSATLSLSSVGRTDAGTYSAWVSNPYFPYSVYDSASLTVRVPQTVSAGSMMPVFPFGFLSRYADGWPIQAGDIGRFEAWVSTNLIDWVVLTNSLSVTNGQLLLIDAESTNYPARYYRLIEH